MRLEHDFYAYAEKWGISARKGYDVVQTWTRVYAEDGSSIKFGYEVPVVRKNGT